MTATPDTLAACPFCGGKAHRNYERGSDGVGGYLSMKCGDCGAMSPQRFIYEPCHQTELEIKADWNRRFFHPQPPRKADMTDELKERVKALAIQHLRRSANGHIGDDFEIMEFAQAVARDCAQQAYVSQQIAGHFGNPAGSDFARSIADRIRARYGLGD